MAEFLMTNARIGQWLDAEWKSTLEAEHQQDRYVDSGSDLLVNSKQREPDAARLDEVGGPDPHFAQEVP